MPLSLSCAQCLLRMSLPAVLLLALPTSWAQAPAQPAHEHGRARLDLAVEGDTLTLALESPLDSLVGFERAPRTDAERQRVAQTVARLRAADALFAVDPAAGCTLAEVQLESAALGLGAATVPAQQGQNAGAAAHADLDATLRFQCRQADRARFVDVALFAAFPGLRAVEVQAATPQGQFKRTLTPRAPRIGWGR